MFLIFTRFKRFRTIRERYKLGGNKRYQIDWLDFVENDIVWWYTAFTEVFLMIACLSVRKHKEINITVNLILVSISMLIYWIGVLIVFFTQIELTLKRLIPLGVVHVGLTATITAILIFSQEAKTNFWCTFLCFYLLLQVCKYIQVIYLRLNF